MAEMMSIDLFQVRVRRCCHYIHYSSVFLLFTLMKIEAAALHNGLLQPCQVHMDMTIILSQRLEKWTCAKLCLLFIIYSFFFSPTD